MEANLKLVRQGLEEPLRGYNSGFNKEVRANDNLQSGVMLILAKDDVKEGSPFFISISKTPPNTLEEFLKKAKKGKLDKYVRGQGGNFRPRYDRSPSDEQ
ncbi:hypothetical protein JHK87_000871 [Glycine soja]|nr:hypothetical protein JHK87_000871 [Glycine soja]